MINSRWLIAGAIIAQFIVYYLGYQHGVGDKPPTPFGTETQVTKAKQLNCECSTTQPVKKLKAETANDSDQSLLDQISILKKQYQALKENTDSLSNDEMQQLPDLLKQTLSQLPIDMVASRIEKYVGIPVGTLEQMPDQQAFVERLSDIAMEGIITDTDVNQFPKLGPIVFSNLYENGEVKYSFSSREVVVFAQFDTATYNQPDVFVKWYRTEDGKVYIFQQMPISRQNANVIWLTDQNGLEPGNYQVAIYDVSSQMNLLSKGSYTVVNNE